jgi:hypothetical protein
MLDHKQISRLKERFPETDRLVQAVNVGSHNEAIQQAKAVVVEQAQNGVIRTDMATDELLQLLLPQVTEEITLVDTEYEWTTIKEWVRLHPKVNPVEAGWMLEDDRLYRPIRNTKAA